MTHGELVARATRWLLNTYGCGFALPEYVAFHDTGEIADVLGYKYGSTILIECKASKQDFKKDADKLFRREPSLGMGDFRYYMCPQGVIPVEDLPEKWGLLYVQGKKIIKVKKPEFIGGNMATERAVFASVLRRAHLRGHIKSYLIEPDLGARIEEINEEIG